MPFIGVGLYLIVALFFGIHAVRRGRDLYWLIILFTFPFLGSIVYFLVVYWPEAKGSRAVGMAKRAVVQAVDPRRELREAGQAYELAPTVSNRMRFARAQLAAGDVSGALQQYSDAAQGQFAEDPQVLQGLANAQLAAGQIQAALQTLEKLFELDPNTRRDPDMALMYARILASAQAPTTHAAFVIALEVARDAEAKCRFADWLRGQAGAQNFEHARALYAEIVKDSRHWHRHARSHNAEWLSRAKAAMAS